jgi:Amt family ammonium transporter
VVVTIVYAAGVTWVLLKVINALVGIRVSPEEEARGLDTTQHGEAAYQL